MNAVVAANLLLKRYKYSFLLCLSYLKKIIWIMEVRNGINGSLKGSRSWQAPCFKEPCNFEWVMPSSKEICPPDVHDPAFPLSCHTPPRCPFSMNKQRRSDHLCGQGEKNKWYFYSVPKDPFKRWIVRVSHISDTNVIVFFFWCHHNAVLWMLHLFQVFSSTFP